MKLKIIGAALLSTALLVPVASFAATYEYVTTNGSLATVVANDADEALAAATNIAATSGVMLVSAVSGVIPSDPPGDPARYDYVSTSGSLESEVATSPAQALTQPTDIAPTSGVILQADMP